MADGPSVHLFRASDGYAFYYRRWAPAGRPAGRLVFLHGIRSHAGWYGRSCGELAAAGYEVLFLDRRGSGRNTAGRGDAPGFRRLLDDVGEFVADLRRAANRPPVFVAGVSWGGKLAVGLPCRRPGLADGVVLVCPGIVPKVRPPLADRLRVAVARLVRPGGHFPIPLNDPELFTASPDGRTFIAADRHGLTTATARLLVASGGLDVYLRRAVGRLTVPTLLVLAGNDRIVDNAATRRFLLRAPGRDVRVVDYPGAGHTLEFEPPGHPFVADLVRWLDRRAR